MINVGIDVGKFKHCFSVIDDKTGEVLIKPTFIENSNDGFNELYLKIKPYLNRKHAVGMEDTGHYMINLTNFLLDKKINVRYINPRTTSLRRKELGWTAKNDKKDSLLIAGLLSDKVYWRSISKKTMIIDKLKEMMRIYHQLKEQQNQDMNRLQKALDIVYPEVNKLSWVRYTKPYMAILKTFPSANIIANTDIRNLRKALDIKGRGRKSSLSAEDLKLSASESIGDKDNIAVEMEVKLLISLIEEREKQISELKLKIEEFATKLNSPITSIPGIGLIAGMTILAEIGDISRFNDSSKLIAFAGMAPRVAESGEYQASHLPITKHGSRYLRKALYQAVFTVCNYEPTYKKYYTSKIDQGKSHRCAQGHCVRKLLRLIYKLLSTNTFYKVELCK